jgi:probable F420-dependent oxidoreductase
MATFRFGLQTSGAASPAAWKDLARKAEDLGYSTLYMPDHLDDQWAPMVALAVAAEATTTLRVGTLVLDNDFRHPVVLAKEAATMDLITGGRFELGMGAGWMRADYDRSGIPMESAAVRIDRLAEALEIMRAMWTAGTVDFVGRHYTVQGELGGPAPLTPGGPPLVIGGGSERILTLAGRYASVASIVPSLAAGVIGPEVAAESVVEKYGDRIEWVRQSARAHGRTVDTNTAADEIEFQCWTAAVQVVPNADELIDAMAPAFGFTPDQLRAAPIALIGTVKEITETLRERRESLGFSYIVVHEAEMEALGPVIAELAGT